MLILNYNNEVSNILHCQGKSKIMAAFFNMQTNSLLNNQFALPEDITILTTFTDKKRSPLVLQLELNGIPYVNSYKEEYGTFVMTDKVKYIVNALKTINTTYVLILDGYDVLIENFDDIIDKFKSYNTRMLFNASKNNYPVCVVDKMPWRDYLGPWNCFNAGCAFGYTKDFIDFYIEAYNFMQEPNYINPYHSEQYILRNIFAKHSENMLSNSSYITIDYKCKIFIALSQAYLKPQDKEKNIWKAT